MSALAGTGLYGGYAGINPKLVAGSGVTLSPTSGVGVVTVSAPGAVIPPTSVYQYRKVAGTATVTIADTPGTVLLDTALALRNANLPTALAAEGTFPVTIAINSDAFDGTVTPAGADTINGTAGAVTISGKGASLTLKSDGVSNWVVIG